MAKISNMISSMLTDDRMHPADGTEVQPCRAAGREAASTKMADAAAETAAKPSNMASTSVTTAATASSERGHRNGGAGQKDGDYRRHDCFPHDHNLHVSTRV
jgi:hypothetical protein